MGTRCLTFVHYGEDILINMYRQFDGYPSGHGRELADFLNGLEIVDGFDEVREKIANGMGCLAAQLIAHFKQSVGGFYIEPVNNTDCGQDYEYHVYNGRVRVLDWNRNEMFNGTYQEFKGFCESDE